MITRREFFIALAAAALTASAFTVAAQKAMLTSAIYSWDSIPVKTTASGSVRSFSAAPLPHSRILKSTSPRSTLARPHTSRIATATKSCSSSSRATLRRLSTANGSPLVQALSSSLHRINYTACAMREAAPRSTTSSRGPAPIRRPTRNRGSPR